MSHSLQSVTPEAAGGSLPKTPALLIEGWRGINHSFAMVNQHQILELLDFPGMRLLHRDMPFAFAHWNRDANRSGFSAAEQARIDTVPEPRDERIDHVYRIVSPFRAPGPDPHCRTATFMITELGLSDASFSQGSKGSSRFTDDANIIVTSSQWSRMRIAEYGFAADKIHVTPLGVDTALFHPLAPQIRERNRAALNIRDDETVFLNIGVAVWNKGIDAVLTAFARLRRRGRRVRLILKDQRDVYGISVERMIRTVGQTVPDLLAADTLAAISVIPGNLDRAQLCALYGVADCYVSPYRAEGFNLPVIEAIACGTPVIVTRGGATDDFCTDAVACRISGRPGCHENDEEGYVGRFIDPDMDELFAAMDGFTFGAGIDRAGFEAGRAALLPRFSWRRAATDVAKLTVGLDDQGPCDIHRSPVVSGPPVLADRTRQHDILDLISILRPLCMTRGNKIRVGGGHDGGYVVPNMALACDTVLSIGVGNDVSFDLQLAEGGARILQFDHTVARPPCDHENFAFHRRGWGTRSEANLLDFDALRAHLHAAGAVQTLLKFDIEGGEYAILDALDGAGLAEFAVIVCELHNLVRLSEPMFFAQVHRCLTKLTLHHAPVHLHANNYGGMALIEGVPMPDVMEVSLLRRDLDVFPGPAQDPIPGQLDRPNHPGLPDLCMTAFAGHPVASSAESRRWTPAGAALTA